MLRNGDEIRDEEQELMIKKKPNKIPLDTSSFRRLREESYIYIDKTRWLYRMIEEGTAYFFSRPRRFGKSLTVSTLHELFKGSRELFKGLWIYDRWKFEKYPVVVFDFNEIPSSSPERLESNLFFVVNKYFEDNEIKAPKPKDVSLIFKELLLNLYSKYNQKVTILIDEYDKPIIDHLGLGKERLKTAEENRDILRNFFGVLKGQEVVNVVKFTFVTGVSRFAKVSIFSEWNNLIDITMNREYTDFLGYTEAEIEKYFDDYLEIFCRKKGFDRKQCMEMIRYWYDGYIFSLESDIKVYSPISLMYCLKEGEFKNYWFKTATPTLLVNLLRQKNYYIPKLEDIKITENLLDAFDIKNIRIEPLLFQSGYLTIKAMEDDIIFLAYPNQEVKKSFSEILMQYLFETTPDTFYLAGKLGKAFEQEDFEGIRAHLDSIFVSIPYPLYGKKDKPGEAYFHTIIYLSLSLIGYNAKSELLTSRGRLDMAIEFKNKVYIIEFKCNQSADKGIEQIKEKGYINNWRGRGKKIILCGINFDTEKREIRGIRFKEKGGPAKL
jgi:hypothetical protein